MKGYKGQEIYAVYNETAFSGICIYGFEDEYVLQGTFEGDYFRPIYKSLIKWSARHQSYYFVHRHKHYYIDWFM